VFDLKRDFWADVIYNVVWFVNFYAVFLVAAVIAAPFVDAGTNPSARWLLLFGIVPFFVNMWARRKIAQGFYRFAIQCAIPVIVLAVGIVMIPPTGMPAAGNGWHASLVVMLVLYMVAILAFSLWQHSATEQVLLEPGVVLTMGLVQVGLYFASWVFIGTPPGWLYFFILAIIFIGSTVHNHVVQVDMALESHNAPKPIIKQILENDKQLTFLLAVALVGMLLVMSLALIPTGIAVRNIFRIPATLGMLGEGWAPDPYGHFEGPVDAPPDDPMLDPDFSPYIFGPRADMIIAMVLVGLVAFFFFLLPRLVRLGIAFMDARNTKFRGYKVGEGEERNFHLKFKKKRRRLADMWADIAPVRREFRNTVRKHMKSGIPIVPTDTPTDMSNAIYEKEDITQLALDYSKARYGKEELVAGGRFARRRKEA